MAAPTGSGKSLAFVLPVLNALANRKIRRLRALVVLPSRDLGTYIRCYCCCCCSCWNYLLILILFYLFVCVIIMQPNKSLMALIGTVSARI
jgi:superfamily II DNA/RNA helicase